MNKHLRLWTVLRCLLFILILPLTSFAALTGLFVSLPLAAAGLLWPVMVAVLYLLLRRQLVPAVITVNGILAAVAVAVLTVLMIIADGSADGLLMSAGLNITAALLCPGLILLLLTNSGKALLLLLIVLTTVLAFFLSVLLQKRAAVLKRVWPGLAAAALCIGMMGYLYANRPSVRYGGHGFEYMHGWSSTDFSDYMVYSEPSKLVSPDSPVQLTIEGEENMPVMDGAEACYPVYAAAAKAVYRDIARIEKDYLKEKDADQYANGKIVTFTNTVNGFARLLSGKDGKLGSVDLFFGARPSKDQLAWAEGEQVELCITPIGREAFVFFVEPDNPVSDLSSEQIRKIYSGEITNWAEVGGKDQEIRAFQRPENSGSQSMMQYFMGDVPLKEPKTYEYVGSMGGVVKEVAQYANEAGAIGYSFRYFVEDLSQENDVRVISVDGVRPTLENIKNGSYPLAADLCLITRKDDPNPNVQKMIDFMLSDAGQEIVEKTGYAGVSR